MQTGNSDKQRVPVTVRIPGHILEKIDASLGHEDVPVSRKHWIIEALVEKLKRAGNGGN